MVLGDYNLLLWVGLAALSLMQSAVYERVLPISFVHGARSLMHEFMGNSDASRLLRERPLSYAMACVIEVLGRWQPAAHPYRARGR